MHVITAASQHLENLTGLTQEQIEHMKKDSASMLQYFQDYSVPPFPAIVSCLMTMMVCAQAAQMGKGEVDQAVTDLGDLLYDMAGEVMAGAEPMGDDTSAGLSVVSEDIH